MTEKALLELDAFMAANVLGKKKVEYLELCSKSEYAVSPVGDVYVHVFGNEVTRWSPTTQRGPAFEVLEACSSGVGDAIRIRKKGKRFGVSSSEVRIVQQAETLELAICLFARELFTRKGSA